MLFLESVILVVFTWISLPVLSQAAIIRPQVNFDKYSGEDSSYWLKKGHDLLLEMKTKLYRPRKHVAKNVVIFLGDGMGVSTITATRIYKGQKLGKFGEEHTLSFENFPECALLKTYNVDKQVPDSAGTATAMFTGVKTRYKMIGLDARSLVQFFDKETYDRTHVESIMAWAQQHDKATGFVTTTRVTHATPAALYAHVNSREWECDGKIPKEYRTQVKDIARQLVEDEPGKKFKVILAGGSQPMGVNNGYPEECIREDGLNLVEKWLEDHPGGVYVNTTADLESVDYDTTEFLMGLFDADHMPFNLLRDRSPQGQPSLTAMTKSALQMLSKNSSNGFMLMVEGGKIDLAHHSNYVRLALDEASEMDDAIAFTLENTDSDTLILVTADHSHSMTMNGYPVRGNDILGYGNKTSNEEPYETITYANGPGFLYHYMNQTDSVWRDVSNDTHRKDPYYQHLAAHYLEDETHGGEDVAIFAKGPGSYMINGVIEQNYVAHVISYVSCVGPSAHLNQHCFVEKYTYSTAGHISYGLFLLLPIIFIAL